MSTQARKAKGHQIRAWHLNRRSGMGLSGLAEGINPQVRWGKFPPAAHLGGSPSQSRAIAPTLKVSARAR